MRPNYERDEDTFSADAYQVEGYKGIAWYVLGWEIGQAEIEFRDDCYTCKGSGETETEDEDYPTETCKQCDGSGVLYFTEMEDCQTDKVVCRMVGDDRYYTFDREEISPINREDYCGECGQIGCTHDSLDRSELDGEEIEQ